jgi:hypothetical protein
MTLSSLVHDEHGAPLARLEGVVRRGRSYEAAARRAALLGRLLDQKPGPTLDAAAPGGVGTPLHGALPTES